MSTIDSSLERFAIYSAALPFQRKGLVVESAQSRDSGVDFYVNEPEGKQILAVEVKWTPSRKQGDLKNLWKTAKKAVTASRPTLLIVMIGDKSELFYSWIYAGRAFSSVPEKAGDFKKLSGENVDRIIRRAKLPLTQ